MVPESFTFIFMSFISGMVAIFTLTNIYRRAKFFFTSLMVTISYSVLYLGLHLVNDVSFNNIRLSDFYLFAGNGVLVLLSYPVIFLFEKKFLFPFRYYTSGAGRYKSATVTKTGRGGSRIIPAFSSGS